MDISATALLDARIEQWNTLKRDHSPAEARAFYFGQVLPVIIGIARNRWLALRPSPVQYDVLISMAGFSPETTIIAFSILRPKNLVVVSSDGADAGINDIGTAVVGEGEGQIPFAAFYQCRCNPTDPVDIYTQVKNQLDQVQKRSKSGEKQKAIIDLTGGKKVMSAAAALAAWRLDLPLCYIDSEFDKETRRPKPGSEKLIFLDHPTSLYGEEETSAALAIFNSGQYAHARTRFLELAASISEPRFVAFMADLSNLYRAWCDLELPQLAPAADAVEKRLQERPVQTRLNGQAMEHLRQQLGFTRCVASGDRPSLITCFFLLGRHYMQKLGRHDFAALLFYRTLEGCMQHRLENAYPGFSCRTPEYGLLTDDPPALLAAYNKLAEKIGLDQREETLPPRLGYINTAAILFALGDRMLPDAGFEPDALGKLKQLGDMRNRSVLAHGFNTVTEEASKELCRVTEAVLRAFLKAQLSAEPRDTGELSRTLAFLEIH